MRRDAGGMREGSKSETGRTSGGGGGKKKKRFLLPVLQGAFRLLAGRKRPWIMHSIIHGRPWIMHSTKKEGEGVGRG